MAINSKSLEERASELWKDDPRMQQKWIEAVNLTRQTKRGWILDKQVQKVKPQ